MDLQTNKRRRTISLHPNKALGATFAFKYVSQLVPALQKIQENASEEEKEESEIKKIVRFQVDMALAKSAEGFAWSRALKSKLSLSRESNIYGENKLLHGHSVYHVGSFNFCATTRGELESERKPRIMKSKSLERLRNREIRCEKKEENEGAMKDVEVCHRLSSLRKLLPGGNEMDTEELLKEVGTYLVCLQQQVHILSCLADME